MSMIYYLTSRELVFKLSPQQEVILEHLQLSRMGKFNNEEFINILNLAHEKNLNVYLNWDILMTENEFKKAIECLQSLPLEKLAGVRVQDFGAFEYLLKHTNLKICFISEGNNHNLFGLQELLRYGQNRLEKIVLSLELSREKLTEFAKKLNCKLEYLVHGPLLIFYSPRNLLSAQNLPQQKVILGHSMESSHKNFRIIENVNGTFMFHPKDHSVIDYLNELTELGVSHFRVDTRFLGKEESLNIISNFQNNEFGKIKENWPWKLFKGYFMTNKSNVLFPKLKNQKLIPQSDKFLGQILDVQKESHMAFELINQNIKKGQSIYVLTPEGKKIKGTIRKLQNMANKDLESIAPNELVKINWIKGTSPKSALYLSEDL